MEVLFLKDTFNNYKNWCNVMGIKDENRFLQGGWQTSLCKAPETTKERMDNMVLWWCLWGEGSVVRFMPEVLCFVFYLSVSAINSAGPGAPLPPRNGRL